MSFQNGSARRALSDLTKESFEKPRFSSLNSAISSNGQPYGGVVAKGRYVTQSTGELRREVDPEGRWNTGAQIVLPG
jgi:hypothetical protein